MEELTLNIVPADGLSLDYREAIIELCSAAFEEDYRPYLDAFEGETHVLGTVDGRLVSHGLWVERWLQVADLKLLRTAYVEGVATRDVLRGQGYAAAVMRRIIKEVQDFELAALSPFSVPYYGRLGWEPWGGPLFARTADGIEPSPEDEEVMIYRLPKTPDLDLSAPLSVEWRAGDVW
ncbi:MAG: GNAT family N-acetyltransferase [Chloroflexota bacterium]